MTKRSTGKAGSRAKAPAKPVIVELPRFAEPHEIDLSDPWYYSQEIPRIVKGARYVAKPEWLKRQQAELQARNELWIREHSHDLQRV